MLHEENIVVLVEEYLGEHFPGAAIERWRHEGLESIQFRVVEDSGMYILRVMDECLNGLRGDEVKPMLEGYNVAQVMRDIGDFPTVVTRNGCIFGSP